MRGTENHIGVSRRSWDVPRKPLTPAAERGLLEELFLCRRRLSEALHCGDQELGPTCDRPQVGGKWGAVARRCEQIRSDLALAHMMLVAHLAKRFCNRGVSHEDLMQEGFCGLLEAIDRFNIEHTTRLGTYASWWIRLAMQRAVAGGAYPVRLTPRHLRQLAMERRNIAPENRSDPASAETIAFLKKVTRPAVSLNATRPGDLRLEIVDRFHSHDALDDEDRANLRSMLEKLSSRETQVLGMRFGLGDESVKSLSEVGGALGISKERVRQIQDGVITKLRGIVRRRSMCVG